METLASSVCILSHRFGAARTRRTPKVTLKIPDQISPHRRLNAKRRQRGLQLRGHATHRFHALLVTADGMIADLADLSGAIL